MKRDNKQTTQSAHDLQHLVAEAVRANENLQATLAELRETVREAHGARSDLMRAIKDAKEGIAKGINDFIDKTVSDGLDQYKAELTRGIDAAEASIHRHFDNMVAAMVSKKGSRNRELLDLIEIGTILDTIGPDAIIDPETITLIRTVKDLGSKARSEDLKRLLELLRPLYERQEFR